MNDVGREPRELAESGADGEPDHGPPVLPPLWRRVLDVFLSPGELFTGLAVSPKWLGALLLGGLITTVSVLLIPPEIYETQLRAIFLERGQDLPGDPARMARMNRVAGSVVAPVFWTIVSLLVAGLATLVFAFILGDRGRFKQYFAAVTHAFLIAAIGGLMVTPLRIAAGDPQLLMSIGNALRGTLPDSYFLSVLRGLDVFGIWANVALAIGMTKIDPRRSFGSAFVVFMTLSIGLAMIAAMFI